MGLVCPLLYFLKFIKPLSFFLFTKNLPLISLYIWDVITLVVALFGAGSALMHHSAGAHIYAAGHIFVVHISCTSLPQRQPFCNDLKKMQVKYCGAPWEFLVAVLLEVLPRSGFSRVLATQGDNIKCFCTKLGVGREGGKIFSSKIHEWDWL